MHKNSKNVIGALDLLGSEVRLVILRIRDDLPFRVWGISEKGRTWLETQED